MYAAVFPLLASRSLSEAFEYTVPPSLEGGLRRGSIVAVPLGRRTVLGVVLSVDAVPVHHGAHRDIASLVDLPPLPGELLEVARRVAEYYVSSLGAALALVTPPAAALHVERRVELTAAGRRALVGQTEGSAALAPLEGGGAARQRRPAALSALQRRGWVAVTYRLRLRRGRGAVRILARGDVEGKGLGRRQRAAVELVESRGTVDERVLREHGVPAASVARLIARGILRVTDERAGSRLDGVASAAHGSESVPALSDEQEGALNLILGQVGTGSEVLLQGVTGSGKTEVYLRAARAALDGGHGVLILVPEIALTGQTVARVAARFPDERLAVLHSGLSAGERLAAYDDVAAGRARVVVGARSAVFAPLARLGLIVVDEEHDASYKQDNEPRYDARTVARWRAAASGAALVLGSATPSVEAVDRVGKRALLTRRADGSAPPPLEIVDVRDEPSLLAPALTRAIVEVVDAGQKAILFLNRRGYAALLACRHCGHTWTCPQCDLGLALFARGRRLRCRLCGYGRPAPARCPSCGGVDLARFGYGTESLERAVGELVPGVDLLRLDSDVAASHARLRAVLDRFGRPGPRILVGTQMIAKGHHFPDVTLVGIINADLTLCFPDFRAEERTFALLVQVGGRSGRGPQGGRVIVQTLDPEARPIALAAAGDCERFYREETERRRQLGYPPATVLVAVEASSEQADRADKGARFVAERLRDALPPGDRVVGPGPLSRERRRYLARVVVKSVDAGKSIVAVREVRDRYGERLATRGARLTIDVEPQWL
jgi:primosomal protein N' (replication factor Y)